MDRSGDEESQRVGPREGHVLVPPTLDDDAHVEAKDEGHRDQVYEGLAVDGDLLERSPLALIKNESIGGTTGVIERCVE